MTEDVVSFAPPQTKAPFFHLHFAGVSWCDGTYRIRRRSSTLYAIEYIVTGRGTLTVDGTTCNPASGDVYLLPRGRDHEYASSGAHPWTKIWIAFWGTLADALFTEYGLLETYLVRGCDIEEDLTGILRVARSHILPRQVHREIALMTHNLLYRIYVHLNPTAHTASDAVDRAMSYMRVNIHRPQSLDEIAEHAGLSKRQLIRRFKARTGQTPYERLVNMKVERAKMLLLESSHSVQQIAVDLGFCDAFHFSKTFRARTGQSPRDFRRRETVVIGDAFPEVTNSNGISI